jgi:hypothetical protein
MMALGAWCLEPRKTRKTRTLATPNHVIPESRAADSSGISLGPIVEVDPGQLAGASFRDDIVFWARFVRAFRVFRVFRGQTIA